MLGSSPILPQCLMEGPSLEGRLLHWVEVIIGNVCFQGPTTTTDKGHASQEMVLQINWLCAIQAFKGDSQHLELYL